MKYFKWVALLSFMIPTFSVYAQLQYNHCTNNCPELLVGAAHVMPNSIWWENTSPTSSGSPGISLLASYEFGFTGDVTYQNEPPSLKWFFENVASVSLAKNGVAKLGFFFAPNSEGERKGTSIYPGFSSDGIPLKGTGRIDDQEVLQLEVEVWKPKFEGQSCLPKESSPCEKMAVCEAGGAGKTCEIPVPLEKSVNFIVTPKVNKVNGDVNIVKTLYNLEPNFHKHLMVNLQAIQSPFRPFKEKGITPNNITSTGDDYFNYLNSFGAEMVSDDVRNYRFLVSDGKSFEFQATNKRETGDNFLKYVFYLEGHYDYDDPTKWPNSHKTFHLRTAKVTPLIVKVEGSGTVTSREPSGILNCTSAGGAACEAKFQAGTEVTLTATPNEGFMFYEWIGCLNGNITIAGTQAICTVKFIEILPPQASFTATKISGVAPLTVELASSSTGGSEPITYTWSSAPPGPGVEIKPTEDGKKTSVILKNQGTYTITLTMEDSKGQQNTANVDVDVKALPSFTPNNLIVSPLAPVTFTSSTNVVRNFPSENAIDLPFDLSDKATLNLKIDTLVNPDETTQWPVIVLDMPPTACFTVNPVAGYASFDVSLDASCSFDLEGKKIIYSWLSDSLSGVTCGDGTTTETPSTETPSTDETPSCEKASVTFNKVGDHEITLKVTDANGSTSETTRTVLVAPALEK